MIMKSIKSIIIAISLFPVMATPSAEAQENGKMLFTNNILQIEGGYALTGLGNSNLSVWGKNYGSKITGGPAFHVQYTRLWPEINRKSAIGIGMEYQMIGNAASDTYLLENTGDRVKDKVFLHYIAPQIVANRRFGDRLAFNISCGAGYMYYHNNGKKNGKSCVTNGNGFATSVKFSIEYYLSSNISLAASPNIVTGFFGKLHQTFEGKKETIDPDDDYDFNPCSIDFTIGVRYHW